MVGKELERLIKKRILNSPEDIFGFIVSNWELFTEREKLCFITACYKSVILGVITAYYKSFIERDLAKKYMECEKKWKRK